MKVGKINNKDLYIWNYTDGREFIESCKESINICKNNYNYRIVENPIKITKDIRDIIKSKKEFYSKIISIYYDDDCVYYVQYALNKIMIDVYAEEGASCKVAHAITNVKKEKKNAQKSQDVNIFTV